MAQTTAMIPRTSTTGEQQAGGDRARGGRVVAGKREVGAAGDQHMDTGHGVVGPGPVDGAADELGEPERHDRSDCGPDGGGNGVDVVAPAPVQVGQDEQHGKDHDAVLGEPDEPRMRPRGPIGETG